jgi:hypothetical protein
LITADVDFGHLAEHICNGFRIVNLSPFK